MFQDVGFAVRALKQAPSVSIAAILSIVLGSGATTVVFSVIDGALLQPFQLRAPSGALRFVNDPCTDNLALATDHPLRSGTGTGATWDSISPLSIQMITTKRGKSGRTLRAPGWPGEQSFAFVMQTATTAGSSAAQNPPLERPNAPRIHARRSWVRWNRDSRDWGGALDPRVASSRGIFCRGAKAQSHR
jgi:hypothetical protein